MLNFNVLPKPQSIYKTDAYAELTANALKIQPNATHIVCVLRGTKLQFHGVLSLNEIDLDKFDKTGVSNGRKNGNRRICLTEINNPNNKIELYARHDSTELAKITNA